MSISLFNSIIASIPYMNKESDYAHSSEYLLDDLARLDLEL